MAFNLKSQKQSVNNTDLIKIEMRACGISFQNGSYVLEIGDEIVHHSSILECLTTIQNGIKELKEHILIEWNELADISNKIYSSKGNNFGSIDNLIFLNSVKKIYHLAHRFSEIKHIHEIIRKLLSVDIASVDSDLIEKFNTAYLKVNLIHRLIINEIYRTKLIDRYMFVTKIAQISGPWANLDLPMQERAWEWDRDGEQEYFDNRQTDRREQIRYNPENATSSGFYFVWNEPRRSPYSWEDRDEESPYPSLAIGNIA